MRLTPSAFVLATISTCAALLAACDDSSPEAGSAPNPTPIARSTFVAGASAWEKIYDRPADFTTSIDMVDDEFGVAVIAHTLQITNDGGRSWQQLDPAPADLSRVIAADRLHWWAFDTPDGLMRTDDGGATWRAQETGTTAPFTGFSVVSAQEVWATAYDAPIRGFPPHGESALLRTVDGGSTWTHEVIPGYGIYLGTWFVDDDGWVLATQCNPGDPTGSSDHPDISPASWCEDVRTLLHTSDAGASWEVAAQEPSFIPGVIDRIDRDHAFGLSIKTLYATSDGGRTWLERATFDVHQVSVLNFRSLYEGWLGMTGCGAPSQSSCDFRVTYEHTTDGGLTWGTLDGLDAHFFALFDATTSTVVAAARGETGIAYFDPTVGDWRASSTNARPEPGGIAFTSGEIGFAGAVNAQLRTDDGGATWVRRRDGDVTWSVLPGGVLATWWPRETIQISEDSGISWREVPPPGERGRTGSVVAVSGDRMWTSLDGAIWRTDDAGDTWRVIVPFGFVQYNFIDEQHAWIAPGEAYKPGEFILITGDGGETWTQHALPRRSFDFVFRSPLEGWGTTEADPDCSCIIATRDGGATWETISTAPWRLNRIIPTQNGRLWALTHYLDRASVVVTSADGGATWQEDFRVEGAYPTKLIANDGRLWLYYSTSQFCFMDGPCEPPRRTIIYRREIEP